MVAGRCRVRLGACSAAVWLARQSGSVQAWERAAEQVGEEVLQALADDGWVEVRHAVDGETVHGACDCGGGAELVACRQELRWCCVDGFCLPFPAGEGLLVWSDLVRQQRALDDALVRSGAALLVEAAGAEIAMERESRSSRRVRLRSRSGGWSTAVALSDLLRVGASGVELDLGALVGSGDVPLDLAMALASLSAPMTISPDGTMVCVRGATTRLQGRTADVLAWLVKNGGEWCSHADLQLAGWPDEITNRGRVRCGQTALDRRLRQVIGELRKVLPGGVVESRRARSGVAGAYRVVHECRVAESRSSIALPMSNSKP